MEDIIPGIINNLELLSDIINLTYQYKEDMISRYIHVCFEHNISPHPNLIADLKDKCYEFYRGKKFIDCIYLIVWSYLCEDRKSIVKDFLQYYNDN